MAHLDNQNSMIFGIPHLRTCLCGMSVHTAELGQLGERTTANRDATSDCPGAESLGQVETSAMTGQWLITNSVMLFAAADNPVITPPEIVAFAPAAGAAPLTL